MELLEKNPHELKLKGQKDQKLSDTYSILALNKTSQLVEFDLSHNALTKLDFDSEYQFNKLKVLDASHNMIESVIFDLKRLEVLNLSHNKLREIPSMNFCPSLKILDLSHNDITELALHNIEKCENRIQELNLAANMIEFKCNRAYNRA